MTYFKNTPRYRYTLGDYESIIKDVTLRVRFKEQILKNIVFFETYNVKDHDTPEKIPVADIFTGGSD